MNKLLDAALDVEAAGRPHSKDCECEQCEAWDKLVRAISKAEGQAHV